MELVDLPVEEGYLPRDATSRSGSLFGAYTNRRLQSAEVLALIRGEVDAIYVAGGRGPDLEALLDVDVVFDIAGQDDPALKINNITPAALTVSGALLDERPDLVTRYVAATLRAARWAAEHPAETRRIIAHEVGIAEDFVEPGYPRAIHAHLEPTLDEGLVAAIESQQAVPARARLHRRRLRRAGVDRRRPARRRPRAGGAMKRLLWLPALLLAVVALAGCGSDDEGGGTAAASGGGGETVTLTVGVPRSFGYLSTLWARDVQPEGVKIEYKYFPVFTDMLTALNSGKIDLTEIGSVGAVQSFANGGNVRVVAVTEPNAENCGLLVPKDSPVQTFADLKGKKIAFLKSTNSYISFLHQVKAAGLEEGDFQIVEITGPPANKAFQSGQLDGYYSIDPNMADLVEQTGGRIISSCAEADVENLYPYVATTAALEDKRDAIGAVIQAVADNIAWIQANPDEQATLLAPKLGFSESAIKTTYARGAKKLQTDRRHVLRRRAGGHRRADRGEDRHEAGRREGRLPAGLQRPRDPAGRRVRALADTVADRSVPRDVRVIASDEEAVAAARGYAASLRPGAVVRDRERQLPFEELRELARTGLLGMRVPPRGAAAATVEVFRLLAAPTRVAQIPQNHVCFVDTLIRYGSAQRDFFLAEFLAGARLGNALSERGGTTSRDWVTRLVRRAGGDYLLNGRKYYSTGALTAQWLPVFALDEAGEIAIAYVPRDAPGVHVDQDWNAFGQRATFSGTTVLEDVAVPAEWVVHGAMGRPQAGTFAAFGQLMHVAVEDVRHRAAGARPGRRRRTTRTLARRRLEQVRAAVACCEARRSTRPSHGDARRARRRGRQGVRRRRRAGGVERDLRLLGQQRGRHRARPRPPLAQRADAHAARSRALQAPPPRPPRRRRRRSPAGARPHLSGAVCRRRRRQPAACGAHATRLRPARLAA